MVSQISQIWNICTCVAENEIHYVSSNKDTKYNFPETYFSHITNKSFETVAKFKYFGMTLTNSKGMYESHSRLGVRNACYRLTQNLLSSHLLSKGVKIKIYRL